MGIVCVYLAEFLLELTLGLLHTCQPSRFRRDCTEFDCYVPPSRFTNPFIDHPVLGGTSRFQV